MKYLVITIFAALALTAVANASAQNQLTVAIEQQPAKQFAVNSDVRLSQLLSELFDVSTAPWHRIQLGSQQLQYRTERMKAEVLAKLEQLPQNIAVKQLKGQITATQFSGAFYRQIPWSELRLSLENNPQLQTTFANDQLIIQQRSPSKSVEVYGATMQLESIKIPAAADEQSIIDILDKSFWAEQANTSYLWKIAANGDVARIPVASFNRKQVSSCYPHNVRAPLQLGPAEPCYPNLQLIPGDRYFIELEPSRLPEHLNDLNIKMVTLLKFSLPTASSSSRGDR